MKLRQLFESTHNNAAIIFGRFNPPHFGHKHAWEVASGFPIWYVGTNQSTQGPKDPLPYEIKVEAMKTIMPELEGHLVPEQSWFTLASMVYKKHGGVTLHIVTDETDAKIFVPALQKSNGIEGPHGFYHFKSIEWARSQRLSQATHLRNAIVNDNPTEFAKAAGIPADTSIAGHPFFDLVKHYMLPYMHEAAEKERVKADKARMKAEKEAAKAAKIAKKGVAEGPTDDPRFQKMMGKIQKSTPTPISGYVALSFASERRSKKIKGVKHNGKPMPDVINDPEKFLGGKIEFTPDQIEQQLMSIGGKYGWDSIDPGQGQGYTEMFFDTSREYTSKNQHHLAANIVRTVNEINKFFNSINRSLQSTGLPGYTTDVWQGMGPPNDTNQINDLSQIVNIAKDQTAKLDAIKSSVNNYRMNSEKRDNGMAENEIPGHSMGFTGGVGPGLMPNESTEIDENIMHKLHGQIHLDLAHYVKEFNAGLIDPEAMGSHAMEVAKGLSKVTGVPVHEVQHIVNQYIERHVNENTITESYEDLYYLNRLLVECK